MNTVVLQAVPLNLTANAVYRMGMKGVVCDIGCGPMEVARCLAPKAERYIAIDIDPMPLCQGIEFYQVPDMHDFTLPVQFDFMFAMSVLIHLTDYHVDACFNFVARHLKSTGKFLGYYWEGPRERLEDWRRFPFWQRPLAYYQEIAKRSGLTITDDGRFTDYGGGVCGRPQWTHDHLREHARVLRGSVNGH